jgi:autotransporter passenger strand-loop-strand repeat protein
VTSGNVLNVMEGGSNYLLQLDPSQNYTGAQFVLTSDGNGGVNVTIVNPVSVTSGQTLTVSPGHTSGGVLVKSGGIINVLSGGTAIGTTVNKGGTARLSGRDIAVMLNGGLEAVSRTGIASGTTVSSGGSQTDLGVTVSTTLVSGAEIVSSGGTASSTVVSSGGSLTVQSRGLASATTVYASGSETISKGGTDRGAQISGGTQTDSGLASGAVIFAGSQVVRSGGTAFATTVWNGATEIVSSGGTTSGTVLSGGQETILRSGHATGAIILSGGSELVSSGGTAVATKISGGMLEVASGGSASGVVFSSGGLLQLDSGAHLSGAISGFHSGDAIDLGGLAYSGTSAASWTQLTSGASASGTLIVKEGASSVTLTVVGSYTSKNFSVTSDGHGGTLVTDPPVISGGYQLGTSAGTAGDTNGGGHTAGVSGGGMVQLDELLSQFAGIISEFDLGNGVDLRSLGFGPSSSATPSVSNGGAPANIDGGGHILSLALLGQYAADFSAGADGQAGALITDPTASGSVAPTPLVAPHS